MTNRENALVIEARSRALEWETGSKSPADGLVRCKDCIYHEPFPDASHRDKNSVYCSTFDLVKWDDGFCESGTDREEN